MKVRILLLLLLLRSTPNLYSQDIQPLGTALENYDYPFPVKYITLEIQNERELNMAYMDVHPGGSYVATVLLLHGKNFCGAYWDQTTARLLEEGFRVVIPDQIGFGKSSKPVDMQYSFHLLAQNTRALLDSLKIERVIVAGHSMGGMLATRFALMYPEATEKLALINPIGLEDWKVKVPYQPVEYWYQNELKNDYESIKNYMRESYYNGEWKPAFDRWARLLAGWTLSPEYPVIAWNSALTYDMIFTQPVVYEFHLIAAPTLLIIGQLDRTAIGKNLVSEEIRKTMGDYPRLGKETAEKIPNATLVELDELGHLPHIEDFDRFITPFLKFLKE